MRTLKTFALAAVALFALAGPAAAQEAPAGETAAATERLGAGIGAGLTIIGAGIGLGIIGYAALSALARQPEVAGRALTTMILIAALLEGVVLFALVICLGL